MICCDLTNHDSFANINNWLEEVGKYTGNDIDKMVLVNKSDLNDKRKINIEEIKAFEKKTGIKVMEVSAKTGDGVENAFKTIIQKLILKK